jgi:hypothetical protein
MLGGSVGDAAPWSAELTGNWPLARGVIAHPPGTARTSTGTGTAFLLGAVSATQQLYATLHVLSLSGTTPTITVKVQSDNNSNFTERDRPADVHRSDRRSGQVLRVAGAITDDWFRVSYTISGTNPVILFAVGSASPDLRKPVLTWRRTRPGPYLGHRPILGPSAGFSACLRRSEPHVTDPPRRARAIRHAL